MLASKRYGYDLQHEDIVNHFDKPVQDELNNDFAQKKFVDDDQRRKAYSTRNGDLLMFVGKSHKFFMAEKELQKMLEYFKTLKDGITVCGGADGECLADIEAMFDHYQIPYELNQDYIYRS